MSTTSPYAQPVEADITAFLGKLKVGIRYPDQVLCIDCSVKMDTRNLDIALEHTPDPSNSCAACSTEI